MWGLEHADHFGTKAHTNETPIPKTVVSRLARYSYGSAFALPYNPFVHLPKDKLQDPATGEWLAKNQMIWLLKRVRAQRYTLAHTDEALIIPQGDEITDGDVRRVPYSEYVDVRMWHTGERSFSKTLQYSSAPTPPSRLDDCMSILCPA